MVLPGGAWDTPPTAAWVVPLTQAGQNQIVGFLVLRINPHRAFKLEYREFFNLVAGNVATAIANARAFEEERKRVETLDCRALQELVHLHGGAIAVESTLGRVSTFSVRLPTGTAHSNRETLVQGNRPNVSGVQPLHCFRCQGLMFKKRWVGCPKRHNWEHPIPHQIHNPQLLLKFCWSMTTASWKSIPSSSNKQARTSWGDRYRCAIGD